MLIQAWTVGGEGLSAQSLMLQRQRSRCNENVSWGQDSWGVRRAYVLLLWA